MWMAYLASYTLDPASVAIGVTPVASCDFLGVAGSALLISFARRLNDIVFCNEGKDARSGTTTWHGHREVGMVGVKQ